MRMGDEAGILRGGAYLGSGGGEGGAIGAPLFACCCLVLRQRVKQLVWTPIYYFTENIENYCPFRAKYS